MTGQRILDVAAAVFAANGYYGARVEEIAERAQVNKATLYYHVGDKDEIYAAVLTEAINGAVDAIDEALEGVRSPEARLRALIGAITTHAAGNPHFAPLMLHEIASGAARLSDDVLQRLSELLHLIGSVLKLGREKRKFRETDPPLTQMFITGGLLALLAGAPVRRRLAESSAASISDRNVEQVAEFFTEAVLEGLRVRRGRQRVTK